ncbi:MAG TPA: nucleotide exchange factor GrpE [Acidimicrobiales bacterium]|jgi:molecular chaperone GrpE|nr:nucleotide exchange factor GrpE [Acidimicrobiales bacterium]
MNEAAGSDPPQTSTGDDAKSDPTIHTGRDREAGDGQAGSSGPGPTGEAIDESKLLRALADLDNQRKRFERELDRARSLERAAVARQWLPIVDDLERALDHAGPDDTPLVEGVRAVFDQAVGLLASLGFPRFDDLGKPFDPNRHEAVGVADGSVTPGTVVSVVRPGYEGPGAVLRPAGVVVSRGT